MSEREGRSGPLDGLRVVEFAGVAPGPFGAMILNDLGAEVLRVDRAVAHDGQAVPAVFNGGADVLGRGRRSIAVDLKHPEAAELLLATIEAADVVIEGFRPGVMERLGLGPDECLARNPRVIYGRMTGWGQEGPLSQVAGHDINYIGMAGVLGAIGDRHGKPVVPANLVGDFGGGGMLLTLGILAALYERGKSGAGQVVDAAMADGAALLTTFLHGLRRSGDWLDQRGVNPLDGGRPYYDTYETSDGEWMAVGAVEPKFYALLLSTLGIDADPADQDDPTTFDATRSAIAAAFASKTRDEWAAVFDGSDACVTPVLTLGEATMHPHNTARDMYVEVDGYLQPAPAPRFSRTPATVPASPPPEGTNGAGALVPWGLSADTVAHAVATGVLAP